MGDASDAAQSTLSLPTGGGAIAGIGESFQPDLFTGTGNFSLPITTSVGRNGFEPQLRLQYSTGNGNGPFGLGWALSVPRIARKTAKGLPRYDSTDVFVLSGAEDLVPQSSKSVDVDGVTYVVTCYRPRTEGLFARIERWQATTQDYWRVTTRDNVTSLYGRTPYTRICHPSDNSKVFAWLLEETYDAKGNHILYAYAQEDPALSGQGVSEENRSYASQRYLRRVLYGNAPSGMDRTHLVGPERDNRHYLFEVVFDYGDLSGTDYRPTPDSGPEYFPLDLLPRPDPFSSYRAGFEVRTLRRCQRVLMFHHFDEPGVGPGTLVRSTDLGYQIDAHSRLSFLASVTVTGYKHQDVSGGYIRRSMPSVTFDYTAFRPQTQHFQEITAPADEMPSRSLGDPDMALVDLNGNGLPDLLHTTPAGYRYWENVGQGHFTRPRVMPASPAGVRLSDPGVAFADLAGDGRADLLVLESVFPGFYETQVTTDFAQTWQRFRPIQALPGISLSDPNARLVDLTGNGLSDVLVTTTHHFLWFPCLGEEGYGPPRSVERRA